MNVHPSDTPTDRLAAVGNEMIEIHLWLRAELTRLRAGLDGTGPVDPPRVRDLRAHCLTFCAALERHHTGEDGGAFRLLAEEEPALRPVLAELTRDHEMVAGILRRIEELVAGDAALLRSELDGLAALLESHFRYEEKKLVTALNALTGRPGTAEALLGVTAPARQPG